MSRRGFLKAAAGIGLGFLFGKKIGDEQPPKQPKGSVFSAVRAKPIPTTLSLAYNLSSILTNAPRVKLVRNPIISRLPNSPIVIIIEDTHNIYDPKENWIGDMAQIQAIKFILESELGIKDWVLGLEGWVDEKIQKERGYVIKREGKHPVWDLIAALKSKGNIPFIGIEDFYYHEQVIKFIAVQHDDNIPYWEAFAEIRDLPQEHVDKEVNSEREYVGQKLSEINIAYTQDVIETARADFDNQLKANGLISQKEQNDYVVKEFEKEKNHFFKEVQENLDLEKYRLSELNPNFGADELARQLKLLESSINSKANERWIRIEQTLKVHLPKEYLRKKREIAPFHQWSLVVRSQKSAEIMATYMKNNNLMAGVMFYGNAHTPSIIEALQKLGDFSIFVVK